MGDIFILEKAFNGRDINFRKKVDQRDYVFMEMAALIGQDKALGVARRLSGGRIYFSKLRNNCVKKIHAEINNNFDGYNFLELAKKYGYSERNIREIVKKNVKVKREYDEQQLKLW